MFRKTVKFLGLGLFSISLIALDGCGPFWVNPYIAVKESQLNWVEIHYYNLNRKPIRRTSVYINGVGHVQVKKGTSDLVSNDFAKNHTDAQWGNIKTYRVNADPKHVNDIFQHLVNYGLLDNEKFFKKGKKKDRYDRFIAVKANMNNRSLKEPDNIFEVDPELAEQLLDVVREFTPPTF